MYSELPWVAFELIPLEASRQILYQMTYQTRTTEVYM